jgi:carboxymethylenebutenolidase
VTSAGLFADRLRIDDEHVPTSRTGFTSDYLPALRCWQPRLLVTPVAAVPKVSAVPSRRQTMPLPTVVVPQGDAPHPAVVIGAEAYGINPFIRGVQQRLADEGFASVVPDYYHGNGPTRTESYDEFTEVIEYIGRLDFTSAARDLADCVDALRDRPDIDGRRVSVWGYCTGGTLAWLAAGMCRGLAAAVLFFPSQPVFSELGPSTPVHPMDLLWQLSCPTLFLYGSDDETMPAERAELLRQRIDRWEVPAELRIYPGANHAFSAPWGPLRHDEAARESWQDAVSFLLAHSGM